MGVFGKLLGWATWWNDATPGTKLKIAREGIRVGEDAFGNTYYEAKSERATFEDERTKRWVKYNGYADPSRIPAEWNGWLQFTYDETPDELAVKRHDWQKEHKPNLTGTVHAFKPKGSLDRGGVRDVTANDYEAWTPGD